MPQRNHQKEVVVKLLVHFAHRAEANCKDDDDFRFQRFHSQVKDTEYDAAGFRVVQKDRSGTG